MRLEHALTIALISTLGLVGCGPGEVYRPWPTARPLGGDIQAYRPARDPSLAEAVVVTEPTGALTLGQALALALASNAELAATSWEVRAAEARTLQAGLGPNPEIRVRMDDFGGSGQFEGTKNSDQTIRLTQDLELGRKASKRRSVARLAATMSGWDYEANRLDVFAETARDFVAALAAQERFIVAQKSHWLAKGVLSAVAGAAKGSGLAPHEQMAARARLARSRLDMERARRGMLTRRRALAANWGAEAPKFTQVVGDFEVVADVPALDKLLARVGQSPEVARWSDQGRMRRAAVELEKANRIPDLRVLGGMRRVEDTRDYGYFLALEIDVPLFDRNQGNLREARFNCLTAAWRHRAAIAAASSDLRRAHESLSGSHAEIVTLRTDVLPAAQEAFDIVSRTYAKRFLVYRDFLDAHRTLFRAKLQQIDALEAYHTAVIEAERLIGQSLKAPDAAKAGQHAAP